MGFFTPFKASQASRSDSNDPDFTEERKNGVLESQTVTSDVESETSKDVQAGVRKIEATAQVWSKRSLVTAYVL